MSVPTGAAEHLDAEGRRRVRIPPVLMYHSVSPSTGPDPHRVRVSPELLDRHLRLLGRLGLRGTSLGELLAAQERGAASGLVGLTFDDGYADFAEHALPVLARHRATATLYVVAGLVGGRNSWDEGPRLDLLDADGVRAVAAAGHEVGSHTLTHADLRGLDAATLAHEVGGSRAVLQDVLQADVPGFCYPWGRFDAAAADAVRAAGYDHACVTGDRLPGDRFTLPRAYVAPGDGAALLLARLARHRWWMRGVDPAPARGERAEEPGPRRGRAGEGGR
ncbi:polysaccharide deacetylase family protein [Geodermatophilus sp. DSM 45219]|uniref:polysaccharide deacetylase family protein n=1 Tax=Geodermatophilus sp. DSM 45219 TaxID=1881103 RepID=UPI00088D2016|nr:polysaccharide deacetylase family protein [Geodermatophilus sp. DSM 45219]SDN45163.1 Polysaccharide deacetylase [Geodermatophilus sp. DSM 45219]